MGGSRGRKRVGESKRQTCRAIAGSGTCSRSVAGRFERARRGARTDLFSRRIAVLHQAALLAARTSCQFTMTSLPSIGVVSTKSLRPGPRSWRARSARASRSSARGATSLGSRESAHPSVLCTDAVTRCGAMRRLCGAAADMVLGRPRGSSWQPGPPASFESHGGDFLSHLDGTASEGAPLNQEADGGFSFLPPSVALGPRARRGAGARSRGEPRKWETRRDRIGSGCCPSACGTALCQGTHKRPPIRGNVRARVGCARWCTAEGLFVAGARGGLETP